MIGCELTEKAATGNVLPIRTEFHQEEVVVAGSRQYPTAEIDVAPESPDGKPVAPAVDCNVGCNLCCRVSKTPTPEVAPVCVESRQTYIDAGIAAAALASERAAAEVDGSRERTREGDIPVGGSRHVPDELVPLVPEAACPHVAAVRTQLDDEHLGARSIDRSAPKVDAVRKVSAYDHIAVGIQCQSIVFLDGAAGETTTPQMTTVHVELGCEDATIDAHARERPTTEIDVPSESTRDDDVAISIARHELRPLVLQRVIAVSMAPEMCTVRGELRDQDVPEPEGGHRAPAEVDRFRKRASEVEVAVGVCRYGKAQETGGTLLPVLAKLLLHRWLPEASNLAMNMSKALATSGAPPKSTEPSK